MSDTTDAASAFVAGLMGIVGTGGDSKGVRPPPPTAARGEAAKKARKGEKDAKISLRKHKERLKAAWHRERARRKSEREDPDSRKGHEHRIKSRRAKEIITRLNKKADKDYYDTHGTERPKGHKVKVSWKKSKYDNVDVYHPVADPKGKHVIRKEDFDVYKEWLSENTPADREIGKPSLTAIYASMTPGESNVKKVSRYLRNKKSKKG